ncbi:hypothetical protein [Halobacillus litoralis]|uniref:hypothetical protein n=1 Tax=Halobacillus litoralis TaxID=45668 RepID=UPI001CFC998B|nr:hypothetical protein [Halobacillus litoralis]
MRNKGTPAILTLVLFSLVLTACAMNDDNNQPDDINYEPARYEQDNDREMNDLMRERNRDYREYQDINELERDMKRDVKKDNEPDTPYNMDEEEPDLDEEPSEQLRERD